MMGNCVFGRWNTAGLRPKQEHGLTVPAIPSRYHLHGAYKGEPSHKITQCVRSTLYWESLLQAYHSPYGHPFSNCYSCYTAIYCFAYLDDLGRSLAWLVHNEPSWVLPGSSHGLRNKWTMSPGTCSAAVLLQASATLGCIEISRPG